MFPFFLFSYFTSTRGLRNVLYMYGKLSLRALHTYIERCMYWLSSGACFVQIGNKWARGMCLGLESLLKKKKANPLILERIPQTSKEFLLKYTYYFTL